MTQETKLSYNRNSGILPQNGRVVFSDVSIALNHTAAVLSPEGLKTFVFAHRNSFPNISTRDSGYENYCLWPIWPPREYGPLLAACVFSQTVWKGFTYPRSDTLD